MSLILLEETHVIVIVSPTTNVSPPAGKVIPITGRVVVVGVVIVVVVVVDSKS